MSEPPVRAIVTDIEGTTTAISFVHEILFPYAAEHLPAFVEECAGEPAVRAELDATAAEAGIDAADTQGLVAVLLDWIAADRKATPLKALQGMIWARGYADGRLHSHIYADAARQLRDWHAAGRALYVYSSGSVAAQKLLFGNTEAGDLSGLFSGWFDTRIGHKREAASYVRIAQEIGGPAQQIGFLSDIGEELDAAAKAGMRTAWIVREGALDAAARHPQFRTLPEVGW